MATPQVTSCCLLSAHAPRVVCLKSLTEEADNG